MKVPHVELVLVDIRSIHNVASIFRTADGAGVSKIHLVGTTPGPIDRFGRSIKAFTNVSLGAETSVPYSSHDTFFSVGDSLKRSGYTIVALEQSSRSIDYRTFSPCGPIALVVGAEVTGVPSHVLSMCDVIMEIPMRNTKESLNVAVATGIALYQITKDF